MSKRIINMFRQSQTDSHQADLYAGYEDYKKKYLATQYQIDRLYNYQKWLMLNQPSTEQLREQAVLADKFSYRPLISILIPLYKTPIDLLRVCLDSVVNQTYKNWQLCVVDDASQDPELTKVIEEYAHKYKEQFTYKVRTKNGHISAASNDALKLADGEFIGLLDHDDILWPNALYEVVKLLQEDRECDFVYTDEDKLELGVVHAHPYIKPAYNDMLLMGCNYITHFAVLRTGIVQSIGGFRTGLEGAQDWDLFLRMSQVTQNIKHLPKLVYSWRVIETSTAQRGFEAKPYAYEAQKRAILEHYKAIGAPIRDVVLPKNHVGWVPKFEVTDVKLSVILSNYSSKRDVGHLIAKIEAAKAPGVRVDYIISGGTLGKQQVSRLRRRMAEISITFVEAQNSPEPTADLVLSISNVFDIQGNDGWLQTMMGFIGVAGVEVSTAPIRFSDHFVSSAGMLIDGDGKPKRILEGYNQGFDQRLDTTLTSQRSVQYADGRVFLCRADQYQKVHQLVKGTRVKSDSPKTVITPCVSFFIERSDKDLDQTSFNYKTIAGSPYWPEDYIESL